MLKNSFSPQVASQLSLYNEVLTPISVLILTARSALWATLWAAGDTARSGRAAPCGQADRGARFACALDGLARFGWPLASRRACAASYGLPLAGMDTLRALVGGSEFVR
jgi:hypothetical protein